MSAPESIALRCVGTAPTRRRIYRDLARAVAARPAPAIVAFVHDPSGGPPWIVARPRAVIDAVRGASGLAGAAEEVPLDEVGAEPSPEWPARFGAAVPRPGTLPGVASAEAPDDPPRLRSLVGPESWLGLQTFWIGGSSGELWAACRWRFAARSPEILRARADAVAIAVAAGWGRSVDRTMRPRAGRLGARRDWRELGVASLPRAAWTPLAPGTAERTPEPLWAVAEPAGVGQHGHAAVFGASGAGKSWFLAETAAREIRAGRPVVALDLHGDLGPELLARLTLDQASTVLCVDLADGPVPGVAALSPLAPAPRAAAHLVAALKRLSPDGNETYWGFRLERVLDAFARLALESGGSLLELQALLTDAGRRDEARLATRDPDLARFLDEIAPIVRRTPDFLWGASARLGKVVSVPSLAELLAPTDAGLPVEQLLAAGRSLVVRVPFALFGPEVASFAGTLALARVYLGTAATRTATGGRPVLLVLDEVQGLSPRLVAEMLAESRKFGFRLVVATQFPDRLAPELRAAVAGTVRDVVAFRVPRSSAAAVGGFLGMSPPEAERSLADLAPGHAYARTPDEAELRSVPPCPPAPGGGDDAWRSAVGRTRREFPPSSRTERSVTAEDTVNERILLAVLASEETGRTLTVPALPRAVAALPGEAVDPALLADRVAPLVRAGMLETGADGLRLTPVGTRRLGLVATTGATRESATHRALLLRAFRIFARHGHLLEIVRQGRYDTQLPDARYRQVPDGLRHGASPALADGIDRLRTGWAWRYFRGRDVFVEAEVSGALRPARIRHGARKAAVHDACVLFLVREPRQAAKVRATVRSLGYGPDRAVVWTLPVSAGPASTPCPGAPASAAGVGPSAA